MYNFNGEFFFLAHVVSLFDCMLASNKTLDFTLMYSIVHKRNTAVYINTCVGTRYDEYKLLLSELTVICESQ